MVRNGTLAIRAVRNPYTAGHLPQQRVLLPGLVMTKYAPVHVTKPHNIALAVPNTPHFPPGPRTQVEYIGLHMRDDSSVSNNLRTANSWTGPETRRHTAAIVMVDVIPVGGYVLDSDPDDTSG